jgi:hypothetical protein
MLLVLVAPASLARASDVDFDQGIDARKIAEQLGARRIRPIHRDLLKLATPHEFVSAQKDARKAFRVAAAGNYYTGLILSWDSLVQEAGRLRQDSRYQSLPANVIQPLDRTFTEMHSIRQDLWSQAQGLDQNVAWLNQERSEIEAGRRDIHDKHDQLMKDMDRFDADCGNRTLPPDQYEACNVRKARLIERQNALNAVIKKSNGRMDAFNAAVDRYKADSATWANKGEAWAQLLQKLVHDIKAALEDNGLKDCEYKSGSSEIIRLNPIESKITCKYDCCGLPSEVPLFVSGKPTQEQIDYACIKAKPRCPGNSGLQ